MRLYSGKVPAIATEIVRALLAAKDIEAESPKEVEADIAAVLNQYLSDEREVNERAKDVLERTGKSNADYQRVRAMVADEKGIKVGDETLDYLLDQVVEMLMHSNNVDEVFVEPTSSCAARWRPSSRSTWPSTTRSTPRSRAQLRHVREGTRDWEIEYARCSSRSSAEKGL